MIVDIDNILLRKTRSLDSKAPIGRTHQVLKKEGRNWSTLILHASTDCLSFQGEACACGHDGIDLL